MSSRFVHSKLEHKYYDSNLNGSEIDSLASGVAAEHNPSANGQTLNSVPQGDKENNRDGRKILMTHLSVSGTLISSHLTNQSRPRGSAIVLLAVVLDKQCNGALLQSENVFDNKNNDLSTTISVFRKLTYSHRFEVLKMIKIPMPAPQVVWDGTDVELGSVVQSFRMDIPLPDILVTYSGISEDIENTVDNSLNLLAYEVHSGAFTDHIVLSYNARLRFFG